MARHYIAFFLLLALTFSFAQSFTINATPISDLVRIETDLNLTSVIPSYNYEKQINVFWNIPDSALPNIQTEAITVYVTAKTDAKDGISFSKDGKQSKEASATLICFIQNGTCAQNSTLNATFAVIISATDSGAAGGISINASVMPQKKQEEIASQAAGLVDEISNRASEYMGGNNSSALPWQAQGKPAGAQPPKEEPGDAIEFLQQNPVLSLTALAIIVVVTGAYLLRSRD
jgi:hypothetical protein